ncbi:hypothetical protein C8J57DRAFT_1501855 [Mycena rebaudengoi]|nr:hypothetical protein C8J57DRAFT_1501855 [Mycena rebaudengoi]
MEFTPEPELVTCRGAALSENNRQFSSDSTGLDSVDLARSPGIIANGPSSSETQCQASILSRDIIATDTDIFPTTGPSEESKTRLDSESTRTEGFISYDEKLARLMEKQISLLHHIDERQASSQQPVPEYVNLMKEQISLLRRLEERQMGTDLSQQPMPEVPATSNSTWGALLRTTIAETIQPKVDRWRSGLDALLVFLGLFSAIVTAFLVESLNGLRQTEAARTNELLANLTDIMIALSGVDTRNLEVVAPAQFQPVPIDVRVNAYWSLSLVLSLCVAALAVTCRGFLHMITLSRHAKATDKLIDIRTRWKEAEKVLGPVIESMPQLLVIPVLLFVVGLVDSIFSDILQLVVFPTPIVVTTGLSFIFITGVVAFSGYSLFDGSIRPHNSPFQSKLAGIISSRIIPVVQPWILQLQRKFAGSLLSLHAQSNSNLSSSDSSFRSHTELKTDEQVVVQYHEIVQAIHDDDALDKASAALRSVLGHERITFLEPLRDEETLTLVHLLSPEASIRANRTAAAALTGFYRWADSGNGDPASDRVMLALTQAARRSVVGASLAVLWKSPFLEAMVALQCTQYSDPGPAHPPVIRILGSGYSFIQHKAESKHEVITLLLDIMWATLPRASDSDRYYTTRYTIIRLLMEAKTAQSVIQAACEVLKIRHYDSAEGLMMVEMISHIGLERMRDGFGNHESLRGLCVLSILKVKQDAVFPRIHRTTRFLVKALTGGSDEQHPAQYGDYRAALEYLIETKLFSSQSQGEGTVMGQDLPIWELVQVLQWMAQSPWGIQDFDIDSALETIRAQPQ